MHIRSETVADVSAVHAVNTAAFETVAEADAVDVVRASGATFLSLVAVSAGEVVGHILFSSVALSGHPSAYLMGLAPMAVSPRHQRQGVGSALIVAGLERCKELGVGAVVVLGHPSYYPRFGFTPAATVGLKSEYSVPDEVFMVIEIAPGYLNGRTGTIKYHPAFEGL